MKKKQQPDLIFYQLVEWSEHAIQPVIDRFTEVTGTMLPCIASVSEKRDGKGGPMVNINGHDYSLAYFKYTTHV